MSDSLALYQVACLIYCSIMPRDSINDVLYRTGDAWKVVYL